MYTLSQVRGSPRFHLGEKYTCCPQNLIAVMRFLVLELDLLELGTRRE
jgi:hypothetical protein